MADEVTRVEATCHCGAVRVSLASAPQTVSDCNCSICRRYGVLWAYYKGADIEATANTPEDKYVWGDRSIEFRRCALCGCVTRWVSIDPAYDRSGINARLMDPAVLAAARVIQLDNAGPGKPDGDD